jgi:hypothetical protein
MTTISNYVSPEELTAWLAEKQNDLYADMRRAIDISNERSAMQSDLADIQKHLTDFNASGNLEELAEEITLFLDKYADNPHLDEVAEPLIELRNLIVQHYSLAANRKASDIALAQQMGDSGLVAQLRNQPLPQLSFGDPQIAAWTDAIKAKGDFLSQQDQLAMIQIQELNGKVNQSEQLVSNLLASQNETQRAVIGNIRG